MLIAKLMMQVPCAFDLRFGDSFETFPIEREQETVVEYARGVYDAGERRVHLLDGVESNGEFLRDRNVCFENRDLRACVSQRLDCGSSCLGCAGATHQRQMSSPLVDEPLRDR